MGKSTRKTKTIKDEARQCRNCKNRSTLASSRHFMGGQAMCKFTGRYMFLTDACEKYTREGQDEEHKAKKRKPVLQLADKLGI
ncbi:MAG TPA: hypothetical protein PKZ09_08910 [Bacillota bacterium]|nr:hypothetical protein [Bacillota bacterium]